MHVLMTADAVGGVWGYSLELARALAPHDVRFTMAVIGELSPWQREQAEALGNITLHVAPFRLEWMPGAGPDVEASGGWLLDLARRDPPDVVHVNGFAHALLPFPVPALLVAHSCVRSWWRAVHGCAAPPEYSSYGEAVRAALGAAHAVIAPTKAMLHALEREYGVRRDARWRVIHNARRDHRQAVTKEPFVLGAARFEDAGKNVVALERVAERLPWPVRIAGAPESSAGGAAHHLGRLEEGALRLWMQRAAIFAHPARYEPFGLAPLEAALAGCALVLGDIPTLRELWDGAALFVPPDDHDALVATLGQLIRDERPRTAAAGRARARAAGFAPQRMAREYLSLYTTLCAPGAAAACAS